MKQILLLLLSFGLAGAAAAQSTECASKLDAINRTYDEQEKEISNNPKVNAIDREYRTLMLYFYRTDRLNAQEKACGGGTRYKSCLAQANVLNESFNRRLTELRNRRMNTTERSTETDRLNTERNERLRELRDTCSR
ncbi:MAG: hypothetical protein EOO16_20730 [Chitinophagaceae bacterium]|nr:MAG: hypothetical protein EOO16_20730 [Chitinophagaceae bacterium]